MFLCLGLLKHVIPAALYSDVVKSDAVLESGLRFLRHASRYE